MALDFSIDHDIGDLSSYSYNSASGVAVSGAAAINGSYGLAITTTSGSTAYATADITDESSHDVNFRFTFDPNSITMASGDSFYLLIARTSTGLSLHFLELKYDGANYQISAGTTIDGGSLQQTGFFNLTDGPQTLELEVRGASGPSTPDGTANVYIDGSAQTAKTGLQLYTRPKNADVDIGVCGGGDSGTSGTIKIDDFAGNMTGTYIGLISSSPVVSGSAIIHTGLGFNKPVGTLVTVTDGDNDLDTIRYRCTLDQGVITVTLSGTATISSGTNGTNDLTVSGTHAELVATHATAVYTSLMTGTDSAVIITATDDLANSDELTFSIVAHTVYVEAATQSILNTALATVEVTNATVETVTLTVTGVDSGGRTGTDTSSITTTEISTTLEIYINDVLRTEYILLHSTEIEMELHTRSTAQFTVVSESPTYDFYRPLIGESVKIEYLRTVIFAGPIERISEKKEMHLETVLFQEIEAVGWEQILDRHLVARSFENSTIGDIVDTLLADELLGEGFTVAQLPVSPNLEIGVFNYQSVFEVFGEISEIFGWDWWIDVDKGIHFVESGTNAAPMDIDNSTQYESLSVDLEIGDYRNRQYVRAGRDVTDARTESFKGDGETQNFTTAFPVASITSIKVNTVAKTVGIRGVDSETTYDWYYQLDSSTISQDNAGTKLISTDTLEVVYTGYFPIIVITESGSEILARQAVEGGSGAYEAVEDRQEINRAAFAYDLANGLLRRRGIIADVVSFKSFEFGWLPSQLTNITLPSFNLSGDYLITRVNFEHTGDIDGHFAFTVEATSGEAVGGWAEFWRGLAQKGRRFQIRENEVSQPVVFTTEDLDINESFSTATDSTPTGVIDVDEWGWCQWG